MSSKAKKSQWWQNRIKEYGVAPANSFLAHEMNARRHPAKQRDALRGSLDALGWIAPVVVSAKTGKMLDGHARIEEALSRNEQMGVPFVEVEVSEEEERLILATLDPISALATYDKEALESLLAEVSTNDAAINQMLADLSKDNGLSPNKPGAGGDDYDTTPDEAQTRVEYGDLWACGDHRVLCGDSTKAEDVAKVMAGDVPKLMVTDPPYGVEYDAAWRDEAAEKGLISYAAGRVGEVTADDRVDWSDAWRLFPGDVVYCWHASWYTSEAQRSLEAAGFEIRTQIIWSKTTFAISRGHYHWQHEPCWYACRSGQTAHWIGDRSQSSVWQIGWDRNVEGGHSTQKPVECMERAIRNHEGDVYDPFGGSGTTLIACERANRKARLIEIAPKYVNVILLRWEVETGKTAQLLERAAA